MAESNFDAGKLLELCIYDYLRKTNRPETAEAFRADANLADDALAKHDSEGLLFDWWSIFSDICMTSTNQNPREVVVGLTEAQQLKARESEHKLRVQQLHIMQQQRDQLQRRESQTWAMNGEFPVPQRPSVINPFSIFEISAQENSVLSTAGDQFKGVPDLIPDIGSNQGVSGPSTSIPLLESNQLHPSLSATVPRHFLPKTNPIQSMSPQEQRFLLAQARAQSNLLGTYKDGEVDPQRQRVLSMGGLNGNVGQPYGNKGSVSYPIQSNSLNNRGDYNEHLLKTLQIPQLQQPLENYQQQQQVQQNVQNNRKGKQPMTSRTANKTCKENHVETLKSQMPTQISHTLVDGVNMDSNSKCLKGGIAPSPNPMVLEHSGDVMSLDEFVGSLLVDGTEDAKEIVEASKNPVEQNAESPIDIRLKEADCVRMEENNVNSDGKFLATDCHGEKIQ